MHIYLRSIKTGLLYGTAKQWVLDKAKARVFKSIMPGLRDAAKLSEPTELFFCFGDPVYDFAVACPPAT